MTIEDKQDYTEKAIARLPNQFVDSTNLINLVSLNSDRMQGINDEAIKMLDGMSLSTASGKQLDNLATILNLVRIVGESDDDFRARILSETAVLAKSGEPSHVIDVYLLLTEASSIFYMENHPAGIQLTAHVDELPNLLPYGSEFDNTNWTKFRVSVTPDVAYAPDDSLTADKIIITDINDPYILRALPIVGDLSGRTFNWSVLLWTDTGQPTDAQIYSYGDIGLEDIQLETLELTTFPIRYDIPITFGESASSSKVICRFDLASAGSVGNYIYAWGGRLVESKTPYLFEGEAGDSINNAMANVKAGGIDMILVISPETEFFNFDDEANVDASGNGSIDGEHGFGSINLSQPEGGKLSRIIK